MNTWIDQMPYCGSPPAPAELWERWNLDPWLLAALALAMLWHARRTGLLRHAGERRVATRIYFTAGWSALILGLVSPICALSVALFSARVTQHMWLMLIAAPLLALASPVASRSRTESLRSFVFSGVAFAVGLWLWHAPRLYELTFTSDVAYWLMHVTLIGSALLLWRSIIGQRGLARLGLGFLTFVQMGLLGALLTLAPRILYSPHLQTAAQWGLSPLQDQQLGGLIMWIPAGFVLVFAALASVLDLLRTSTDERAVDVVPGPGLQQSP
jgi:putative membrane protein